ncbi:signal peptidase I [Nonomuraea antimicrobica]
MPGPVRHHGLCAARGGRRHFLLLDVERVDAADRREGARLTVRRAVGGYVPRPGDVVVFTPADWTGITPDAGHVSRVIGVPGSTVVCCDSQGRLEVNGKALDEPYLALPPASHVPFSVLVPAGRLWMMSDNRHVALDSRAHRGDPGEGTVAVSDVDGQVSLPVR